MVSSLTCESLSKLILIFFSRLVARLERDLLASLDFDPTIEGIIVISVSPGSIIADFSIIYSPAVSQTEAFDSFRSSVINYARKNADNVTGWFVYLICRNFRAD